MATLSSQSVGMDGWLESAVHLTFGTGLGIDIDTCLACGGAVRIIACIKDLVGTQKIFDHLKTKGETCEPFSYPKAGPFLDRIRLTPPSPFNPGCCDLEAHSRVAVGRPPGMVRTWRWRGVGSIGDARMEPELGRKRAARSDLHR